MALEPIVLIGIVGLTAVLGYVSNLIFERTKIADVIWLMLFGIALSYFKLVPQETFAAIAPLLAAVALLIIMLDAGLHIEFYQLVRGLSRSFALAVLGLIFSMAATAGVAYFLGFDIITGLFLGAILGGTGSAIVITLVQRLRMSERLRTILTLESILTDPITIVVALALMGVIMPLQALNGSPAQAIASAFSVGAVIGIVVGVIWLWILDKVKGQSYDYMLTVGMAFVIYTATEFAGGSGAIAALFFGLALGNAYTFSRILKLGKIYTVSPFLKKFHGEITFFIRAFFFVLLGLIASFNQTYLIYGIAIAAALIAVRFIFVRVSLAGMGAASHDKWISSVMAPRGLASAVLAQLAVTAGVPQADVLASIVFIVIFATVIYTVIASVFLSRAKGGAENGEEEKPVKKRARGRKKPHTKL